MPRPVPKFGDFVGRSHTVSLLRRQLAGAQARGVPFPHTQLNGPSGAGKSLLARALAAEAKTTLTKTMGTINQRALAVKLSELKHGDILFVDECHRLGNTEQELIMQAINDLCVPNESNPEELITIPPWTLILATDQPEYLLNALLKRIVITIDLDYYSVPELKEIAASMAADLELLLSPQAARAIAEASRGLPRQVEHHLQKLRNHFADSEKHELALKAVRHYLAFFGFDSFGLGLLEQRYMVRLHERGVASIGLLARMLGTQVSYLETQIEIHLIRRGFVEIGRSGRRLTANGELWVKQFKETNITKANEMEANDESDHDRPPLD